MSKLIKIEPEYIYVTVPAEQIIPGAPNSFIDLLPCVEVAAIQSSVQYTDLSDNSVNFGKLSQIAYNVVCPVGVNWSGTKLKFELFLDHL